MTTKAPSVPELLDATRDWQRKSLDEAIAQCNELMLQARNAPDPEVRKVLLAEVNVLSSLGIERMEEISAERVHAYTKYHEGRAEDAVANLLKVGKLIRESGLPGLATYVATVQTHVDALSERMGNAEGRLDRLEERVSRLERGAKPSRQSTSSDDTPKDWSKTKPKESWSDRKAKVQALFKKHVGIQQLPFKEAFANNRYKPAHSARG